MNTESFPEAFLYPFGLAREITTIRTGIFTISEKWELSATEFPEEYQLWKAGKIPPHVFPSYTGKNKLQGLLALQYPWLIPLLNDQVIRYDFDKYTTEKKSAPLPPGVQAISPENIFIEEGATLLPCIINATEGPVYIGKNSLIMEGCTLRGPLAICEGAVVKMGAKIYGATTIGAFATAGGEIKNSVMMDYSNKAHEGYLGDSVIGAWCNLGAGTSNSNLKNTAGNIRIFLKAKNEMVTIGKKCGLIMGDYSRAAINTSFNTATVVGIAANVFGTGLTPKYIPDFSWGAAGGQMADFDKLIRSINNWMDFKQKKLSDAEIQNLQHIFEEIIKK